MFNLEAKVDRLLLAKFTFMLNKWYWIILYQM